MFKGWRDTGGKLYVEGWVRGKRNEGEFLEEGGGRKVRESKRSQKTFHRLLSGPLLTLVHQRYDAMSQRYRCRKAATNVSNQYRRRLRPGWGRGGPQWPRFPSFNFWTFHLSFLSLGLPDLGHSSRWSQSLNVILKIE